MNRIIQSPGIELREIDRSGYDETTDNSIVGTNTFVLGFTDKGDDYDVKWINSLNTLKKIYGDPTNEAETYFYNACWEVLNRGGLLTTAKIPYHNNSFGKYTYQTFEVENNLCVLKSPYEIASEICSDIEDPSSDLTSTHIHNDNLIYFLQYVKKPEVIKKLSVWKFEKDIINYVKKQCNFSFDDYQMLNDEEKGFGGSLALVNLYKITETTLSGELSSYKNIKSSINQIFKGYFDIVQSFTKTLTSKQFKEYYNDLSSIAYKDTPPEISSCQLDVFDNDNNKYASIKLADNSLTSYIEIKNKGREYSGLMDIDDYDRLLVGNKKANRNQIIIVDKTRQKYDQLVESELGQKQYRGIMPVIVSPANAIYFQGLIDQYENQISDYNILDKIGNIRNSNNISNDYYDFNGDEQILSGYIVKDDVFPGIVKNIGSEKEVTILDDSVTKDAVNLFPTLKYAANKLERTYLKQIGVIVFKVFKDYSNDGKIGFLPVESFVGSLDRTAKDKLTNKDIFIDRIINENSKYINFFSNVDVGNHDDNNRNDIDNASLYLINNQNAYSLGFYSEDTKKTIKVKTMIDAMNKIFDRLNDVNTLGIDLVMDAGMSNIAQYIASTKLKIGNYFVNDPMERIGEFDLSTSDDSFLFRLNNREDMKIWQVIAQKFDDFCKLTRKDCMFVCDSPRTVCLDGNAKFVRSTKPENTFMNTILPKLRLVSGVLNSSYSAGYCNWFYGIDNFTGNYYWIPPSIKAVSQYLYTDTYANYWNAPAGMNRGKIQGVVDVAFNPNQFESDQIYLNFWNYAISYPLDGIVLEGQHTFQQNKTALDRVNVRRLMLGLERVTRNYAKYYNYEQNTAWLRQRFVDTLSYYFDSVKTNDGIAEYYIICDDRNNTVQTIENHELHVTIGIRPVKSIEFIIISFICTNQSANVQEVTEANM